MNNQLFPTNIVTRKKSPAKQPPAKKPKKAVKKAPRRPRPEEETPKEKSELEKLRLKTSKKIPDSEADENTEISLDEDNLPEDEESEEPETITSDRFLLKCEGLEAFRVKNVELPKMIFMRHKQEQSIKDKSNFMIYFYSSLGNNSNGKLRYPYRDLMESCKKNVIALSIDWLDENGNSSCLWKFNGARIQGLDLGNAAYERTELAEAAIEISYETINIDGIEF